MKAGKIIVLALAVVFALGLFSTAKAQSLDVNRLCLHNGAEYYLPYYDHTLPNRGGGKYFPSFAHWSAQGVGSPTTWPWQIRGWEWSGLQANNYGPTWKWGTFLQYSVDNPYATSMTFNYPVNYCLGLKPHSSWPWLVYQSHLPMSMPSAIADKIWVFPSTYGGFDSYLNVFATGVATWNFPSTLPYYGFWFAFVTATSNTITLASNSSVYEFVFENCGPYGHYILSSHNEMDCTTLNGGNKGRNYMIGTIDHGGWYYYNNGCTGGSVEWGMCIFVQDAVTIPVNVPGAPNSWNGFASYGFDVGISTLTPLASSGQCTLKAMYEDYLNPGTSRALIAASPWSGPCVPYGPAGFRIPHAWDAVTNFFSGLWWVWQGNLAPGYPASMYGTTVGGHSIGVPIPADPALLCLELKYSGFSVNGKAPTASFMVCYF